MNCTTLLWALDISPGSDEGGNPILPSPNDMEDAGLVVCVSYTLILYKLWRINPGLDVRYASSAR